MPVVKPISELQRNMSAIARECQRTKKPIYLTKNGAASLVVMDAEAFDAEFELHAEVREREERVYRSIMRGYDDMLAGRTRTFEQACNDAQTFRNARGGAHA